MRTKQGWHSADIGGREPGDRGEVKAEGTLGKAQPARTIALRVA